MGIISNATGQTYSDQDVKDWFNANNPSDQQVAQRAAELNLNQDQITQALSIGRNGQQDPSKVSAFVADAGNGYKWDEQGGLIKAAQTPTPPPRTAQAYTAPMLGNPTPWNVTPEQTVEGRIQSIINPNNPIIAQARTRANEAMNQRGLMNSGMAISAAEDAAYTAAIPIATTDAGTYSKAAGWNADQSNQFALKNADLASQAGQANLAANTQLQNTQIGADTQMATARLNADTQKTLQTLDTASRERITQFQATNNTLLQSNQQAAQAFNQAVVTASNINMSTTMDANTKTQAVASIWRDLQSQLKVLGAVAGLNLTAELNLANYPGFDASGNWIGFQDAQPAAATATATGTTETA